jgi:hypothetical protein
MQVFNPTGLLFGPVMGQVSYPENSMTAVVKGSFTMRPGQRLELTVPEDQNPMTLSGLRGDGQETKYRYPSDFAFFKPRGEIILKATCFTPGGEAATSVDVSVEVADLIRKVFRVTGRRSWIPRTGGGFDISDPVPFRAMPIRYENAFGGPGHAANPVGQGLVASSGADGATLVHLPSVEYPGALIKTLADRPPPACFGPLEDSWEPRKSKFGTIDDSWHRNRAPWFPADLDWGYFNEAASDQQLTQGYFQGDEELRFTNMHPLHADYTITLPGIRPRCFVQGQTNNTGFFVEIPLKLDTIWVNLDDERVVLLWRGLMAVNGRNCEGVEDVLLQLENLSDAPRAPEYFQTVLAQIKGKPFEVVETPATEAEAKAAKQLSEAFDGLKASGVNPEILDAIESTDDPVEMLNKFYDALRRVLGKAGMDLPPDPR